MTTSSGPSGSLPEWVAAVLRAVDVAESTVVSPEHAEILADAAERLLDVTRPLPTPDAVQEARDQLESLAAAIAAAGLTTGVVLRSPRLRAWAVVTAAFVTAQRTALSRVRTRRPRPTD